MDTTPASEGPNHMTMTAELTQELETYESHKDELLGSSEGMYVLIHGDEIIGTFVSQKDAVADGYKRFGNVAFLVKKIEEVETPLNFVSRHLAI